MSDYNQQYVKQDGGGEEGGDCLLLFILGLACLAAWFTW